MTEKDYEHQYEQALIPGKAYLTTYLRHDYISLEVGGKRIYLGAKRVRMLRGLLGAWLARFEEDSRGRD